MGVSDSCLYPSDEVELPGNPCSRGHCVERWPYNPGRIMGRRFREVGPQAKAPEEEVRGTANPLLPEVSGEALASEMNTPALVSGLTRRAWLQGRCCLLGEDPGVPGAG